ncbi:MAG: hypothetical protein M3441_15170 [Chloroflexota bacterium]|nr:hypothetical protein [Chloroflexota bacterium]
MPSHLPDGEAGLVEAHRSLTTHVSRIEDDVAGRVETTTRSSWGRSLSRQEREIIKRYVKCLVCQSVPAALKGETVPSHNEMVASCILDDLEAQALKHLRVTNDQLLMASIQEMTEDVAEMTETDRAAYLAAVETLCIAGD